LALALEVKLRVQVKASRRERPLARVQVRNGQRLPFSNETGSTHFRNSEGGFTVLCKRSVLHAVWLAVVVKNRQVQVQSRCEGVESKDQDQAGETVESGNRKCTFPDRFPRLDLDRHNVGQDILSFRLGLGLGLCFE
jgi:hypothetical protein